MTPFWVEFARVAHKIQGSGYLLLLLLGVLQDKTEPTDQGLHR